MHSYHLAVGVVVEFKEDMYSVMEDDSVYNVTLVMRGNLTQTITVRIIPVSATARGEWSNQHLSNTNDNNFLYHSWKRLFTSK